jgi:hypothetical protein
MTEETIDVKIVSKRQKIWELMRNEAKELIQQSENNLIIQKEILRLAEENIEKEKKNLNIDNT